MISLQAQERAAGALDRPRTVSGALSTPPTIPVLPAHGRVEILLIALGLAALISFPTALILDCLIRVFTPPNQMELSLILEAGTTRRDTVLNKEAVLGR
jgi:hypothetical protein